jgi:CBS-domain-containing membrane protein
VVPGCHHAVFVDVHHLTLRSEGGGHDPNSLVVLCAAHHRALHRGSLILEGDVTRGLVFRHADGSLYGGAVSAGSAIAQTRAFAALRRLGFRESDVRCALDRLRTQVGLDQNDCEQILRAALRLLAPLRAQA